MRELRSVGHVAALSSIAQPTDGATAAIAAADMRAAEAQRTASAMVAEAEMASEEITQLRRARVCYMLDGTACE